MCWTKVEPSVSYILGLRAGNTIPHKALLVIHLIQDFTQIGTLFVVLLVGSMGAMAC